MKQLVSTRVISIPAGVEIEVKARKVRVKGPRGKYISINQWDEVCGWREQP